MRNISLFVPITYGNLPKNETEEKIEFFDSYFNITGWSARVINKDTYEVDWHYEKPSYLLTVIKILSYITLVIPLFVLARKDSLRAGCPFKFKEQTADPKTPEFDLSGDNIEIKTRQAVEKLLNLKKFEAAKDLLKDKNDAFIDELKVYVECEEVKESTLKAIKERRFDEVYSSIQKIDVCDERDDLLEAAILEANTIDPSRALKLSEISFKRSHRKLLLQRKVIEKMIEQNIFFVDAIKSLPVSNEKDDLLLKGIKALMKEGVFSPRSVISLLNEPFKNPKAKTDSIEAAFPLFKTDTAKDLLEVLMKPGNYTKKVISENESKELVCTEIDITVSAMNHICEAGKIDLAYKALEMKSQNAYAKVELYERLAKALIDLGRVDEGMEVIKKVYDNLAAKNSISNIIKHLAKKERYEEAIALIDFKATPYTSDYVHAFAEAVTKGYNPKYDELVQRHALESFLRDGYPELAKKIYVDRGYN